MTHNIQIAAGTDVGLVRTNNEDNFTVNPNLEGAEWAMPDSADAIDLGELGCLLAVADGMGGTNAGEVASAIAMETMRELFVAENLKGKSESEDAIRNFMTSAVKTADLNIVEHGKADTATRGMGTTIVMAWVVGDKAYICWCGDSRCYVFNASTGLCRLSKDHSYVQQLVDEGKLAPENAMHHPYSNVITRCLGSQENRAEPDFRAYDIKDGDCLLLCSDGLHGLCTDDAIIDIIQQHAESLTETRDALIQAALDEGGHDNVTVALCRVCEKADETSDDEKKKKEEDLNSTLSLAKPKEKKKKTWKVALVVVLLLIAAAVVAMRYCNVGIDINNITHTINDFINNLLQKK